MQYVICATSHNVKNHKFEVNECGIKIGKICTYVTLKCATCDENHQATGLTSGKTLRYKIKYQDY